MKYKKIKLMLVYSIATILATITSIIYHVLMFYQCESILSQEISIKEYSKPN